MNKIPKIIDIQKHKINGKYTMKHDELSEY